jgi:branched-subunit amino acid aminotransferase/4-amino-4-deoxychorismate lyase
MKIWVNRQLVEDSSEYLDDKNWPLGTGLFETIRTENGSVQFLARHMRRVISSARECAIPIPDEEMISAAIDELLSATPHAIGKLRLSFSSDRFIATHEIYTPDINPSKLMVSQSLSSTVGRQHKAFPYSSRLELLQDAIAAGFDEVIVIDQEDRVREGAVSNFAFRIQGQWRTPPITAGILPGVIRAVAVERCGVVVKDLSRADVTSCEAAIVLSSLKIALPVASIDERSLAIDSDVSDICSKLRQLATAH